MIGLTRSPVPADVSVVRAITACLELVGIPESPEVLAETEEFVERMHSRHTYSKNTPEDADTLMLEIADSSPESTPSEYACCAATRDEDALSAAWTRAVATVKEQPNSLAQIKVRLRKFRAAAPPELRLLLDYEESVSLTDLVVNGTWVTTGQITKHIVEGWTWNELLRHYPELTENDIRACLMFAHA